MSYDRFNSGINGLRLPAPGVLTGMPVAANMLAAVWRSVRDPGGAIRAIARLYRARQRRQNALCQLAAMSDLELKDIGISRYEIRAVAWSRTPWPRGGLTNSAITATARGDSTG